jgi:hypothetical protein
MEQEIKDIKLVRPTKCHFCDQPMFYSGDKRHEPEVCVSVESWGDTENNPGRQNFHAHVRCWNERMAL